MKKRILAWILVLVLLLSGCSGGPEPEITGVPSEEGLIVHFLDVGQADCALLESGGEYLLIDGGNRGDSDLVVSFLEQQGVEELAAVVCTHAHEDHVGGLPAVLAVYPTAAVYAPTRTYASQVFDDFAYYADQQGLDITIPAPGDSWMLGIAEITVLGPVQSYAETNDTSLVLRVELGDTAFLFTGDMEVTAEDDLLDYWEDEPELLKADVLKVGHHGSDTSTGYRFVYQVEPEYAVVSVRAGNSYGHPNEAPLSRLNQAGAMVLRTDELGTIQAVSDGETVTLTWENQSAQPETQQTPEEAYYIGNVNSRKFHTPDCRRSRTGWSFPPMKKRWPRATAPAATVWDNKKQRDASQASRLSASKSMTWTVSTGSKL